MSQRGPSRIQHDFLKLMAISSKASSLSLLCHHNLYVYRHSLWWTFLSGSLPFSFISVYYCCLFVLTNKVSDLIEQKRGVFDLKLDGLWIPIPILLRIACMCRGRGFTGRRCPSVCLSVCLFDSFVFLSPVKFIKSFATRQHLAAIHLFNPRSNMSNLLSGMERRISDMDTGRTWKRRLDYSSVWQTMDSQLAHFQLVSALLIHFN